MENSEKCIEVFFLLLHRYTLLLLLFFFFDWQFILCECVFCCCLRSMSEPRELDVRDYADEISHQYCYRNVIDEIINWGELTILPVQQNGSPNSDENTHAFFGWVQAGEWWGGGWKVEVLRQSKCNNFIEFQWNSWNLRQTLQLYTHIHKNNRQYSIYRPVMLISVCFHLCFCSCSLDRFGSFHCPNAFNSLRLRICICIQPTLNVRQCMQFFFVFHRFPKASFHKRM